MKPLKDYLDLKPASGRLTPSFIDAKGLKASQRSEASATRCTMLQVTK